MLVALEQLKKGNVRSSYHELQRGPRSLLWASDIHFPAGFPMSVTLSRFFSTPHPPHSQSSRETKAASHVLQTVWSYKELRNTLTKDGWNKSHFQVRNETGNQNKILFSSAVQLFAVPLTHSALHPAHSDSNS